MGYTAQKLLDIARSQIGYYEKASNKQLDDFTANKGAGNWTKFARDLYYEATPHYFNGNKNGFAWCCVFQCWIHWVAAGKDKAEADRVQCQSGKYGAACNYAAKYYKEKGRLDKNPKVGDQIFFGSGSTYKHTGVVEDIDDTYVYTIEGNASNMVKRNKYKLTSSSILAYGHPFYDEEESNDDAAEEDTNDKPIIIRDIVLPTLKYGSPSGAAMKSLVLLLNSKAGANLSETGAFKSRTETAVKQWQKTHGIEPDGVVEDTTWASLIAE